jgi:hypothetical protein
MIIALLTLGACDALEGEFQNVLPSAVCEVGIGAWSQCAGAVPCLWRESKDGLHVDGAL